MTGLGMVSAPDVRFFDRRPKSSARIRALWLLFLAAGAIRLADVAADEALSAGWSCFLLVTRPRYGTPVRGYAPSQERTTFRARSCERGPAAYARRGKAQGELAAIVSCGPDGFLPWAVLSLAD